MPDQPNRRKHEASERDDFASDQFDEPSRLDDDDADDDPADEPPARFDPDRWDDFGADFEDEEPEPEPGDFWAEIAGDEPL